MNTKLPGIAMRNVSVLNDVETPIITNLKKEGARLGRVVVAFSIAVSTALPFAASTNALAAASNNNVAPGTSNNNTTNSKSPTAATGTPITPTVTPVTTPQQNTSPVSLPTAVTGLAVTSRDRALAVSWNASASVENVTGYDVRYSTTGTSWTTVESALTSPAASVVISGLENGVTVFVQVSAKNASGTGPAVSTSGVPSAKATAPRGASRATTPASGDPYGDAVRATSPSGYWPLTDAPSANSVSASASVGQTLNGKLSFGMPAPIGGTSAAYVSSQTLESTQTVGSEFGLEAWVNPSTLGDAGTVASVGNTTNGASLRVLSSGALQFIGHVDGKHTFVTSETGLVSVGSWNHVAVSVQGGNAALYVNGVKVMVGDISVSGGAVSFAGNADTGAQFIGSLAHLAVYSNPLTARDVTAHWDAAAYVVGTGTTPSARGGDGFVVLEWSAPANNGGSRISGYNVEVNDGSGWKTVVENTFTTSTSLFITTFADGSRIANGTTYTFRVSAMTESGQGIVSDSVDATPRGGASAPASFDVVATGNGSITFNWAAPANNGGYAITGYRIEESDNGTDWRLYATTSADTRSITMTDIVTGTPFADAVYHFRVRAESSNGVGASSSAISVAPLRAQQPARAQSFGVGVAAPTVIDAALANDVVQIENLARATATGGVPGRVINLVATPAVGGATLSWSVPTDTGTSALTGYTVQSSTDLGTWVNVNTSATSPYAITGLTVGTTYYYRVFASNGSGAGTPTMVMFAVPGASSGNYASAPGGPSPAAGTVPVSGSNNSESYANAVLADAPTSYWKLNEAASPSTVIDYGSAANNATNTSATFGGAINPTGTTSATFSAGKVTANANTAYSTRTFSGDAWINLSGSAPAWNTVFALGTSSNPWGIWVHNSGSIHTRIQNTAGTTISTFGAPAGTIVPGKWTHVAVTYDGTTVMAYINGAPVVRQLAVGLDIANVSNFVTIGAEDNSTTNAAFAGSLAHVAIYGTALSPERIKAHVLAGGFAADAVSAPQISASDETVTMSWNAPLYSNGAVTGYELQYATDPYVPVWTAWGTTASWITTFTGNGFTNNTNYVFRVRALTASGAGQWSSSVMVAVLGTTAPPTSLSAVTSGQNKVTLSWVAPTTTTLGNAISPTNGYRIDQSIDGGVTWTTLTPNTGSTTLSYVVDGVTNGLSRIFRVAQVSYAGVGAFAS
ncbi:MAG: hypothetical protein RLZ18_1525, partial [Actinomycetota bacterium]